MNTQNESGDLKEFMKIYDQLVLDDLFNNEEETDDSHSQQQNEWQEDWDVL